MLLGIIFHSYKRKFNNLSATGCCWHIFTAFIKLIRIIKWKNFALKFFRFWLFLQLLLQNLIDSTSLRLSRSKIRFFRRNSRSGLLIWLFLRMKQRKHAFLFSWILLVTNRRTTSRHFLSTGIWPSFLAFFICRKAWNLKAAFSFSHDIPSQGSHVARTHTYDE